MQAVFKTFDLERGRSIHTVFGTTEHGSRYVLSECASLDMAVKITAMLNRELAGKPLEGLNLPDPTALTSH